MTAFLWAMVAVFGVSIFAQVTWITSGQYPIRRPATTAMDMLFNVAFLMWCVYLVAQ